MKKLMMIILLVNTPVAFPQGCKNVPSLYWMDAGVGADNNGLSGQISANYINKNNIFKLRYIGSREFILFTSPSETVNDIGILFGKALIKKYVQFTASGGIGIVTGLRRGKVSYMEGGLLGTTYYEKERITGVGVPIELECLFRPLKFVGFGLGAYANLNRDRTLYGLLFKIQIGKLR
jgi:hypothetical protein